MDGWDRVDNFVYSISGYSTSWEFLSAYAGNQYDPHTNMYEHSQEREYGKALRCLHGSPNYADWVGRTGVVSYVYNFRLSLIHI